SADRRGAGLWRAAAAEEDPPHGDHRAVSWPTPIETLEALGQSIVANSAGAIESYSVAYGELGLTAPAPRIVQALTHLRDHADCQFQQLTELTAVDYPTR